MDDRSTTRRRVLVGAGAAGIASIAGCFEPGEEEEEEGEGFGGEED